MENKQFIDENFCLDELLEIGFIEDKADYDAIEKRIVTFFGLNNIYEYNHILPWESDLYGKGIKTENIFSEN